MTHYTYLPSFLLFPPLGQSKVPNCIVLCVCGISIALCFFPSSIRFFFTLYKELLEIHVIFVSSTNIRRTCKFSSSNYELLNRQVRFAPYSTNIRRIELVRKFDRSPSGWLRLTVVLPTQSRTLMGQEVDGRSIHTGPNVLLGGQVCGGGSLADP